VEGLDDRDDDDDEQDGNPDTDEDAHLHILPPHVLANSVCAPSESLGGHCEVIGLIPQHVDSLAALSDLGDVLPHNADGVIDLLLDGGSFGVARCGRPTGRIATGWG